MRISSFLSIVLLFAGASCTANTESFDRFDGPPVIADEKADGAGTVEVVSRLRPGTDAEGELTATTATTKFGYVFYATSGTVVDVEVPQRGATRGLDTRLQVYGPRTTSGLYEQGIAEDDDSGYAKLSKVSGLRIDATGFYLAVVSLDSGATLPGDRATYHVALRCGSGTCDTTDPVQKPGLDVRWVAYSAEFRAAARQAYRVATEELDARASTLPSGGWAVVLDIDETTLSNLTYQRERAELGVGYSSMSWLAWVRRREATPIPGARAFIEHVQNLGGRVVLVSNRKEIECADTEANLEAEGIPYDAILCRTSTSDKNPRFESVANGTAAPGLPPLEVAMFVGDNIQDFPSMTQDLRFMDDPAYADFGSRFVLIPNPMYGSWEQNVE